MALVAPLYSAEQIQVPAQLPDVLKAFTKEVIKRQPVDILRFSATYFADLSKAAKSAAEVEAPTKQQLRQVFWTINAPPDALVESRRLLETCRSVGINEGTLQKALTVGRFGEDGMMPAGELLIVLLAMSSTSHPETIASMFMVMGEEGRIATSAFLNLILALGVLDKSFSPKVHQQLSEGLKAFLFVEWDDVEQTHALDGILENFESAKSALKGDPARLTVYDGNSTIKTSMFQDNPRAWQDMLHTIKKDLDEDTGHTFKIIWPECSLRNIEAGLAARKGTTSPGTSSNARSNLQLPD
ncbi:hypothetical protein WJX84_005941 [Apatococcus fuscideae]|uniref:RIIa domain-containing protein n=1 Tax=Apatococcus fuscideae TaxID=2026836 RepID=A0AAW1SYV0_9CHLO